MNKIIKKSTVRALSALLAVLSVSLFAPAARAEENSAKKLMLSPGGMPFGIQIMTEGLLVVGFSQVDCPGGASPAYEAGIRENDTILKINGREASSSEVFLNEIENCGGEKVEIIYRRGGEEHTASITPALSSSDNKYKIGMWLRDSTAGIGTVTFFQQSTGAFAGLGHGICDSETGDLLPMRRGTVVNVAINGITKGTPGTPGELLGYFISDKTGSLVGNTPTGVYGAFSTLPKLAEGHEAMEADSSDIHEGEAYIMSTLDDNSVGQYSVKLSELNKNEGSKNFSVTVTDQTLLEKTGGIVQGMSGSPVIQDGKLVGAITHVLISDPTRGYGIFIENMINGMPDILK